MQARRWGRFIAITSVAVKQPLEGLILSNSIRCGVSGLVKTLAAEYGACNVLVNNVCPGFTATDRLIGLAKSLAAQKGVTPEEIEEAWVRQAPLRRVGAPRRVGQRRGFSRLRTFQLCHRSFPRGGWRNHKGIILSLSARGATKANGRRENAVVPATSVGKRCPSALFGRIRDTTVSHIQLQRTVAKLRMNSI